MNNYCICVVCGEEDDRATRTGACIDNRYHCFTCWNERIDKLENEEIRQ